MAWIESGADLHGGAERHAPLSHFRSSLCHPVSPDAVSNFENCKSLYGDNKIAFGSSGCQSGCTIAVVSAQWPVEHVKNPLQNIVNEGTPQSVESCTKDLLAG